MSRRPKGTSRAPSAGTTTRRAEQAPDRESPVKQVASPPEQASIVSLQRVVGNSALQRLLTKPAAAPADASAQAPTVGSDRLMSIDPSRDVHEQAANSAAEAVARADEPEGPLSAGRAVSSSAPGAVGPVPDSVRETLASGGEPMRQDLREEMEGRFQHDFSSVRVHSSSSSERSARELEAAAYTVGNDIAFGPGRFDQGSPAGRRLIAHELAHVVQQAGNHSSTPGAGGLTLQRQPDADAPVAPPTVGNLPREDTIPARKVALKMVDGKWKEVVRGKPPRTARGWYDYVLKDGQFVAVKRTAEGDKAALENYGRPPGHTEAAGGQRVTYAGKVHFSKSGQVTHWDDQSGHYRPAESVRNPVVEAGFPENKFRVNEAALAPKGPGPRAQLPVFQPSTRSRDGGPARIRPGPPRMEAFEARYGKKTATDGSSPSGTVPKPAPPAASSPSGTGASPAPSSSPSAKPAARLEVGEPLRAVNEETPGYAPGRGAALGGAVQMLQAKMFGNLQQAEREKFAKRLGDLQGRIDGYLESGATVELTLIVERPSSPDVLCAAGTFCDAGQLVYFNELYISRVTPPRRDPLVPRAPSKYPSISPAGGRDSFIPYVSQGGSLTAEEEIPFMKARHPNHRLEYAKEVLRPQEAVFPIGPAVPQVARSSPKPKQQVDQATRERMAAAPSRVFLLTENMKQFAASVQTTNFLSGNRAYSVAASYQGGAGGRRYTIVTYFSDLDRGRAEMLAKVVRDSGVPTARAELSGDGSDVPGVLQIFFGKDAER